MKELEANLDPSWGNAHPGKFHDGGDMSLKMTRLGSRWSHGEGHFRQQGQCQQRHDAACWRHPTEPEGQLTGRGWSGGGSKYKDDFDLCDDSAGMSGLISRSHMCQ